MWSFDDQSVELIELTKVDVTMDFKGSFLPSNDYEAYYTIKDHLDIELSKIFSNQLTNFLSQLPLNGLKLMKGGNTLASCF